MPCKQYFLNNFGQNKGYHGLLQLFSVKFIFFDKAMNSGEKYNFHYFFFELTKIRNMGVKWLYMQICAKFLISRFIIGGAMAISLVAMAKATLILFLDVVFEPIKERICFIHFSGSLVDSFCLLSRFSEKWREKL